MMMPGLFFMATRLADPVLAIRCKCQDIALLLDLESFAGPAQSSAQGAQRGRRRTYAARIAKARGVAASASTPAAPGSARTPGTRITGPRLAAGGLCEVRRVVAFRLIELPLTAEIDAGRRRHAQFVACTSA